jgi:quercetin dioxygenase-like cupin family protein
MFRASLLLAAGIAVGAGAQEVTHQHQDDERVKVLSARDIREKLDGKQAKATIVEVTIQPGQPGAPHRHPGPAFGYVIEGEYEWAIDEEPAKILKPGDTFYEPTGCLHRVSKNPGKSKARVIAVVLHPRNAKQITIPEPTKD